MRNSVFAEQLLSGTGNFYIWQKWGKGKNNFLNVSFTYLCSQCAINTKTYCFKLCRTFFCFLFLRTVSESLSESIVQLYTNGLTSNCQADIFTFPFPIAKISQVPTLAPTNDVCFNAELKQFQRHSFFKLLYSTFEGLEHEGKNRLSHGEDLSIHNCLSFLFLSKIHTVKLYEHEILHS